GEISLALQDRRNGEDRSDRRLLTQTFEQPENESFISLPVKTWNPKRPTQIEPELIAMDQRARQAGPVREEVVRIQVSIAQELKRASVDGIRAGFRHHVHGVSHTPAVLRGEGIRLDLEFL